MPTYNSAINKEVQAMLATTVLTEEEIKVKTSSGDEVSLPREITMISAINTLRETAEGIVADRRKIIDMSVGTDHCYIGLMRP